MNAHAGNALASQGGFCAGPREMVDHQRLSGLGYCFSASLPPYLTVAATAAVHALEQHPELLEQLRSNAQRLRSLLQDVPGKPPPVGPDLCLLAGLYSLGPCGHGTCEQHGLSLSMQCLDLLQLFMMQDGHKNTTLGDVWLRCRIKTVTRGAGLQLLDSGDPGVPVLLLKARHSAQSLQAEEEYLQAVADKALAHGALISVMRATHLDVVKRPPLLRCVVNTGCALSTSAMLRAK